MKLWKRLKLFYRLCEVGIEPAVAWKRAEVLANAPKWDGKWGRS